MSWIEKIKVGDTVVISSRYWRKIAKVDRITDAGNIVVGNRLFNKNGIERGCDTWNIVSLQEYTPELVATINIEHTIAAAYKLMGTAKNITYGQAVQIIKILSPKKEEKERDNE
jgi:hypothetical protein